MQALTVMSIRISGKQIEIGEALPGKVRVQLETALAKHFDGGADSHVVFSHEGAQFRADCTTHLDSGVVLKAEGLAPDAHRAFDVALDKLEKQVRRYKRRLKNHHERAKTPGAESA
jgi:ribosomal subunit interface protein